jgi:hypothetical protein
MHEQVETTPDSSTEPFKESAGESGPEEDFIEGEFKES